MGLLLGAVYLDGSFYSNLLIFLHMTDGIGWLTPDVLQDLGITLFTMLFVFYFVYRFLDIQLTTLKKRAELDLLDTYHVIRGEIQGEDEKEPQRVDLIVITTKKRPVT